MDNIIFATQTTDGKPCGIGLIGKLMGECLEKSKKYKFTTLYTDSNESLFEKIIELNPVAVIYNYHISTTEWAKVTHVRDRYPNIKYVMLNHDVSQDFINNYNVYNNFGFKYVISPDPTLIGSKNVVTVNRLIPNYPIDKYIDEGIPTFGFQGFGEPHKGIFRLVNQVISEFDEAIVRLHIPAAHYGAKLHEVQAIVEHAKLIAKKKPGIKIEGSHDLLSTEDIVKFLSRNTINCYLFDYFDKGGLASSPDYALAAKRPIAVTKSYQLRNFFNINPSICIEDNSLRDIISFGIEPLKNLYDAYSEDNVIKNYESAMEYILSQD